MGDSVISKMICLHDSPTFFIFAPAHRKNFPDVSRHSGRCFFEGIRPIVVQ